MIINFFGPFLSPWIRIRIQKGFDILTYKYCLTFKNNFEAILVYKSTCTFFYFFGLINVKSYTLERKINENNQKEDFKCPGILLIYTGKQLKGGIELTSVSDLYQLNPDPAKNLNPDPDPEDLEAGSGSKLFLNTILKKIKLLHNYKIFS